MVEAEALIESGLAHVTVIVLGVVGVVAMVTGTVVDTFWFWVFYGLAWLTFLELFEQKGAFWESLFGEGESASKSTIKPAPVEEDEDPVEILKRRYAEGAIDDDEFEARLDGLLETPDTLAELESERAG